MGFAWGTPVNGLDANLNWRYVGKIKSETDNAQMPNYSPNSGSPDERLPAMNYFDLSAAYKWRKVTARLGINNVFDRDPPLVGTDFGGGQ